MRRKGKTLSNEDVGYLVFEQVMNVLTDGQSQTTLSVKQCNEIARQVQSLVYQELEKEVK
jgi:hypothetical protein